MISAEKLKIETNRARDAKRAEDIARAEQLLAYIEVDLLAAARTGKSSYVFDISNSTEALLSEAKRILEPLGYRVEETCDPDWPHPFIRVSW